MARLRTFAFAAAAALVIAALVVPVVSTLQPGYYRRFPGLGERMDHWATSTHSRITCAQCHVPPGFGAKIAFAARSIPAYYSQLFGGPKRTNLLTTPGVDACRTCHTNYRRVAPSGDLLIPHKAHVEVLKLDCAVCHKNLVHSPNRRGFNRPEMETCLTCHDGDKASNKCSDCHTRKNAPASHGRKSWVLVHGKQRTFASCDSCHDWTPNYCADCHKRRPASHVGNWKTSHAAPARLRGDGCLVCHGGKRFCKECH